MSTRARVRSKKLFAIYVSRRGSTRRCIARVTQKREAIRQAKRCAKGPARRRGTLPRQVSVYEEVTGRRPDLRYQAHFNTKLGRLITEEL